MKSFYQRILLFFAITIAISNSCSAPEKIVIRFDQNSSILTYGVERLAESLQNKGYLTEKKSLQTHRQKGIVILHPGQHLTGNHEQLLKDSGADIVDDGYKILNQNSTIYVIAKNENGCLNGIMDLKEELSITADLTIVKSRSINPALSFRAIKFNLPWSPYRPGPATELHTETCRDLKYWRSFLDMMAENRFNALTLWNTHPFPYMIRSESFPKATPFTDEELAEWKAFWQSLFKMAKERGVQTYLVNWNIVVSPEFADAYGAKTHFDRSDLVKKYTRESVTQVINEYEDLTGIGVTLADWMGNWGAEKMTPTEREDWIKETFVEGMKAADRKVKFIHRAVLAGDPNEMRRVIDHAELPDKTIVEVKFNWSHGHSTPNLSLTHSNNAGAIMREFWDPHPDNYFIAWMIRNEDFFVLPWGDPEFIRSHIRKNHHAYVDGYFVGSEGYIPAVDYSSHHFEGKNWTYAFQKQWLFYQLWGKLLFNPAAPNSDITRGIRIKYPATDADRLLKAYSLASKVPQYIASFYKGTWDFTLYSEGFLAPWQNGYDDKKSPFISLEELIRHETLDQRYVNIETFCALGEDGRQKLEGKISPQQLAGQLFDLGQSTKLLIQQLRDPNGDPSLNWELDDLETWSELGFYFAEKIRAGLDFCNYSHHGVPEKKQRALEHLENCAEHWQAIISLTETRYHPMPYVSMGHHEQKWPDFKEFHWKNFLEDVYLDIEFVRQYQYEQ